MNKKELKKFINDSGFFLQLDNIVALQENELAYQTNSIQTKYAKNVPSGENIVLFRGTATQKFGVGEMSRNGYKIDIEGWDWKNYLKNPQILLQHDRDEPIGHAIEIVPGENSVEILYYVDLNTMSKENAYRVQNGFFGMMSTGHITKEVMFEHKETGERLTLDEFRKFNWEESRNYILVVTKAEAIEVSVVTIPSNPDAVTSKNSMDSLFQRLLGNSLEESEDEEAGNAETSEEEGKESEEKTEAGNAEVVATEVEDTQDTSETEDSQNDGDESETNGLKSDSLEDVLRVVLNEYPILKDHIVKLVDRNLHLQEENKALTDKVALFEKQPVRKALLYSAQGKNAMPVKEESATAFTDHLKARGLI